MPLFGLGSNGSGQLGIGHVEDVSIPTRCDFDGPEPTFSLSTAPGSLASNVVRIAAGGNHTLLLLPDGAVYSAGCNEDGRCGRSPSSEPQARFCQVVIAEGETTYESFQHVSATWEATFLVISAQRGHDDAIGGDNIYVLGSGGKGELGLGEGYVRATTPVRMSGFPPRDTRIVSLTSGMGHTVAVLSNGEVYGWGAARKGQLGEAARGCKIAWTPVKIDNAPFYVTDAACGREFTVLIGDKSAGEFAVLGSADNKWNIVTGCPAPGQLQGFDKIAASWHGIYVHQADMSVVAWGRNDRGQLPPAGLPKTTELAVGSEHVLGLVDSRDVAM
ncbi:regulator of chromosome condensation 1/beta-lactamase-inhibitor protein II [Aspergillus ambiguus]|uniref:regulator of chromosome condensation 1/beta-lactamase-inhibitor protein II n=1 Tax=Aspergillus ambiguus TaxID=176160 RepID=UPI003CCC947E